MSRPVAPWRAAPIAPRRVAPIAPRRVAPIAQLHAASVAGRLAAQGLIAPGELMPRLLEAAIAAAPGHDRRGLRTRLAWRFHDARRHWQTRRARAERDIAQAIAPLLEGWAAPAEIRRAARAADAEGALLAHERRALVEQAARRRLAKGRRHG